MSPSAVPDLRQHVRDITRGIRDRETRARRVFLGEASFATASRRQIEFDIKDALADHFNCAYGSIHFCGSAHLGFSPTKGSDFKPGESDLDVALVDVRLFQSVWIDLIDVSLSFSDLTKFGKMPDAQIKVDIVKDMIAKRGVIHLDDMPLADVFERDREFLNRLSANYTALFKGITVSFYMNEYAFCMKQDSALQSVLGVK